MASEMKSPSSSRKQPTSTPSPAQIRALRRAVGLTQTKAGALIYSPLRTWQDWEAGIAAMPPALFALFTLKLAPAPALVLEKPQAPSPGQIQAARKSAGLTQGRAAALLSAKPRAFEAWESGISHMHPGIFELLQLKIARLQAAKSAVG